MPQQLRKRTSGAIVLMHQCEICGTERAYNGRGELWSCAEHLERVERMWLGDEHTNKSERQS